MSAKELMSVMESKFAVVCAIPALIVPKLILEPIFKQTKLKAPKIVHKVNLGFTGLKSFQYSLFQTLHSEDSVSITSTLFFLINVKSNTENVCKLTHYDPRCVGSCVIITYIVHRCLTNQEILKSDILCIANEYDSHIIEYIELAYQNNVEVLALDEQGKIGYTLKTMSAALWAYNYSIDFYSGLRNIIEQGGDADTNGAVAGALLGLKFGLNTIPKHLIDNLVGKDILANKINDFRAIMQNY